MGDLKIRHFVSELARSLKIDSLSWLEGTNPYRDNVFFLQKNDTILVDNDSLTLTTRNYTFFLSNEEIECLTIAMKVCVANKTADRNLQLEKLNLKEENKEDRLAIAQLLSDIKR